MGWLSPTKTLPPSVHCWACSYFRNDAAYLEASFKGMTSFSSGYASVRSDDGICTRHDRYLGAKSFCAEFLPKAAA
jgi:hypothetical protein